MNFTDRILCINLFISDIIEFKTKNDSDIMDKIFCGTDWEGIWAEIQTDKISGAISEAVSLSLYIFHPPGFDTNSISVNPSELPFQRQKEDNS